MAKYRNDLTAERVRELLDYDPETGELRQRKSRRGVSAGEISGYVGSKGYVLISVGDRMYRAHRIVWLHVHGRWPAEQIDHINGVRSDNRISNLREATNSDNGQNRAIQRNNTSRHPGVGWHKQSGKWRAQIKVDGEQIRLGYFGTLEEAAAARAKAKAEFHAFQPFDRDALARTPAATGDRHE